MTSKKRKYGDLSVRPLPIEDESMVDDVFAAFTKRPATSQPALSQPTASQLNVGQPNEPPVASPMSQLAVSQPEAAPLNLLDAAPDSAGYTKTPNRYYDHLCPHLTPDEQAIYAQLFRLSHGYGKDTCFISNNRLSERSNIPLSTLKRVVGKLVGKGMIAKVSVTYGPGKEQGITYRVPALSQLTVSQPRMSQPAMAHNKENALKENNKKGNVRLTPDEIQSFTSMVVDLFGEGKSVEEVEASYAPSMHPADWAAVRSVALAQGAMKKGKS